MKRELGRRRAPSAGAGHLAAVNRTPVSSAAELAKVLRQEQGRIALNVQRGEGQTYLLVR